MTDVTDLTLIQPSNALAIFTAGSGLDPYLAQVRAEIDNFTPDVSTRKGRDAVASMAYRVAKIKTYLDGVGKDLVDEHKEIPKKIDAERRRVRDILDSWKEEVRAPLTKWERMEEERVAGIKAILQELDACASDLALDKSSECIRDRLAEVEAQPINATIFAEYLDAAKAIHGNAIASLHVALEAAIKRESEAAELEALRAEKAKRDQADAEARAKKEAQDHLERIEREKEQAAKVAAEREKEAAAAREKAQAQAAAQREAALQRQAEEAKERAVRAEAEAKVRAEAAVAEKARQEEAERVKRERDKKHKAAINQGALAALVSGGVNEEQAKLVITLIAKKLIPAVSINY